MTLPIKHIRHYVGVAISLLTIIIAGAAHLLGYGEAARWIIIIISILATIKLSLEMIDTLRSGKVGIDILAVIAIISTLSVNEYWASIVIILMLTGGDALEKYASDRAKTELTALISNAPQEAHKVTGENGETETVAINDIVAGDTLLIRPGEVIPVDSTLQSATAVLDESSLTGESLPVTAKQNAQLLSGAVNTASAITIVALRPAAESQYQKIIALVSSAVNSQAPFVRLADRFAVPFTVISLTIGGLAWLITGDPVRFAEVLVLATPCPLLLATPIALISGMSLSAKNGIIIKSGAVLEQLSRIKAVAFDKTGTLTHGAPVVSAVHAVKGMDEATVVHLAATAEQQSLHTLAAAVSNEAKRRSLVPDTLTSLKESVGNGVVAICQKGTIIVGKKDFLASHRITIADNSSTDETSIYVALNDSYSGSIAFEDTARKESRSTIKKLHELGVQSIMILTGDATATATRIGRELSISDDAVHAQLLPEDKVTTVKNSPVKPIMMVGDGVNDAPVLAVADVGVAMGARGSSAATETADVVVLVDDISKTWQALFIAQRSIAIATQGIIIGIGVSIILMLIATTGIIPAIIGAALQEILDVVIILNALRVHSINVSGKKERARHH